MSGYRFEYGQEWNEKLKKMHEPIRAADARIRFTEGPWFSVAKLNDHDSAVPLFSIQLEPQAEVAKVIFYNSAGSVEKIHLFARLDSRLFMESTLKYEYPSDDKFFRMSAASILTRVDYKPDGIAHITTNDLSRPDIERVSYENVDIAGNWEPMPKFGEWEGLGRRDRS